MNCTRCIRVFNETIVRCSGEECDCNEELCIFCCFFQQPRVFRELIEIHNFDKFPEGGVGFLCYACGRTRPMHRRCLCCPDSFLCASCCPTYSHYCCRDDSPVNFVSGRPLRFVHPAVVPDSKGNLLGWTTREQSEAILTRTASIQKYNINPKGFIINNSRRFAAVEIEVLDYGNAKEINAAVDKWKCNIVQDNSMIRAFQRENPGVDYYSLKPFEINTTPACGDALLWQLEDMGHALKAANTKISLGCGIHVHIDCRDFGYQELQKFLKVYYFIEETLFAAVHWSRSSNEFCRRCGQIFKERFIDGVKPDTKDLKTHLITSVYGNTSLDSSSPSANRPPRFHGIRADHYGRTGNLDGRNPMRYSAINLHSYFLRGTVESRIHHGSNDYMEIYNWAKILIDLFDTVGKTSDQKLQNILTVKKTEIIGASSLLNLEKSSRNEVKDNSVAIYKGLIILRSLLPDNSFNNLVSKIETACLHPTISSTNTLPCQI